ncbi:MAG: helix-turn-helix domain-containing protein [Cyclobacteriaceae bacterium]
MQVLLNQFVYFGFLQAVFLLGIYIFSKKYRENINGYLAFLIGVLIVGLSGRVINATEIFEPNRRFITVSEFSNLLFGSTVYLFTRSSLLNRGFSKSDLLHYVPALIYSTLILLIFILPSNEQIRDRFKDGGLYQHVLIFIGFALIFNIAYWVASVRIFVRINRELGNELSYSVKTKFFRNFLAAIGICLLIWVTFYFISMFGLKTIEIDTRHYIWTSIALIILFITYYTMKEPELFKVKELMESKKYTQSRLSTADLDALKSRLDQLMEEKKPYLNRNLMKADLAEMLGVNNPEVARLLNESIGMNFFEYVNYHRIREFVELAKTERAKNLTFFGLAQEAGFNSKTTFNKSFKKLMGTSPREYFARELN